MLVSGFLPSISSLSMESFQLSLSSADSTIQTAFDIATFLPQPLWLILIVAPSWSVTKLVMGQLWSIIAFSLVHLFIVISSTLQTDGTALIAEFAKVFDPVGDPLGGMLGMMKYPNFVSEEWSHVLTWDLFVGRWIWIDGLKRNIFTSHSILLTNLIGPPGLLLHLITCFIQGRGLPIEALKLDNVPSDQIPSYASTSNKFANPKDTMPRADGLIKSCFVNAFSNDDSVQKLVNIFADDIVWEDLCEKKSKIVGVAAAADKAFARRKSLIKGSSIVIDNIADGVKSSGYTWYFSQDGLEGKGLRGTTFISLDTAGQVNYICEIAEPLYKPGASIIPLLKAVTEKGLKDLPPADQLNRKTFTRRQPVSASDLVQYLWIEAQGQDKGEFLGLTADDMVYEDLNYDKPFYGKQEIAKFLDEFNFPGINFVPEKVSDGIEACCFTWRVELAGVSQATRGISFYQLNSRKELSYLRDIPEPVIKPPPLGQIARLVRPGLRKFKPTL